jgi:two-component system, sensor histidine kinase ChiS
MAEEKSKILLVEDEKAISKAYGEFLGSKGYEMFFAYDGEEGLKKAQDIKPDLILLDLLLPKKDGLSLLKELENDSNLKDIPVIILSNLTTNDKIAEAISLGSTTYLVKTNYTLDDVLVKVKETLHGNEL